MKNFVGKIAVVTGGGSGMGRELARQLVSEGCHVAICDVLADNLTEAAAACEAIAPPGTRVTAHECDVSDESQVITFRDSVLERHATDHVHLLFNNAGIAAGASFLTDDRAEWDRVFAVCWSGVYYCSRAFMPLLVASPEACIVNTSSLSGLLAGFGPGVPASAYGTAKFAVRGFTEALLADLRNHAPHVKAAVAICGLVGTSIALNTWRIVEGSVPEDMTDAQVGLLRAKRKRQGVSTEGSTDDDLRASIRKRSEHLRKIAPLSASGAAAIILNGVRAERWRILVGEDAVLTDRLIRENPEAVYEPSFRRDPE